MLCSVPREPCAGNQTGPAHCCKTGPLQNMWRKKHSKPIFLATALSHILACTLWRRQVPCSRAALTASSVLLPEEEPARIQTAPTDCIWNYIIQAKQLDCSLKSSDCRVLVFVLSTKERKRKKSCFFPVLCAIISFY